VERFDLTPYDILTSSERHKDRLEDPECTLQVRIATAALADKVTRLLNHLEITATVVSGFRTKAANASAHGASDSHHMTGHAVDLCDLRGRLSSEIMRDPSVLDKFDLYLENPQYTPGWLHVQDVAPKSGHRIFTP
jgi:hypothetical protein